MGFLELKSRNLPAIEWKEFTRDTILSKDKLWTVRSAIYQGMDLNLPRLVGAKGEEATSFANRLLEELAKKGMVIYYPYFEAKKSGNLRIGHQETIIEGVAKDLWNLVTHQKKDVTLWLEDGNVIRFEGDETFFSSSELEEIISYIPYLKREFSDDLIAGRDLLLEFSFANYPSEAQTFLIFYELRTI